MELCIFFIIVSTFMFICLLFVLENVVGLLSNVLRSRLTLPIYAAMN